MGFYFRKSLSSGPFRINFSKNGISYSVGVKGARINSGPRGTYVNIGANGIYYRKKIGNITNQPNLQPIVPEHSGVHSITSANIDQLTDIDSKAFIDELTEKANKISYVNWFGFLPLVIFLTVLFTYSFEGSEVITQQEADRHIAIIDSYVGSNIRALPDADSKVIRTAHDREEFTLLDSTKRRWLKIQFGDTIGYLAKKLAKTSTVHDERYSTSALHLVNPYFLPEIIAGIILFIVLIFYLSKKDRERFAMEIQYEMDERMKPIYEQFVSKFLSFNACSRKWQYLHSQRNQDWKRNAGAGSLINRIPIAGISDHKVPNKFLKTNVKIPYIKLRNTELFFLPERLLIRRGNQFAAVFYKHLEIYGVNSRFIEDDSVPRDAQVVDYTWKYVNRNGGPDRRFNNNRRIPICVYSQYTIKSRTGVHEVITTSKVGGFDGFSNYLNQIGILQSKMTKGVAIS